MKAVEIQNLDQHLKPLQVGGVSTGLELSTESLRISSGELEIKNLTAETAKVDGSLTVDGAINMTSTSVSRINLADNQGIEATSTTDNITIWSKGILLTSSLVDSDGDDSNNPCSFILRAATDYDSKIAFMSGVNQRWHMANDEDDSSSFKIGRGLAVGTDTRLTLSDSVDLTIAGDIVAGDDIAVASGGKLSLDGIGGHTYIEEAADDNVRIVVGGDRMIELDGGAGDDKITLQADNLVYERSAGDEWSVANSAWAGTIIGYRMIGEDTAHTSYTLTTSLVVPDSDMTVRFEAPPSGAVEVMVQVYFDGNMGRSLLLGLSDNATYNTIGVTYETLAGMVDESDQQLVNWRVVVTGLTAGNTYNYWLGASANGGYLTWGGTSSLRYADFIMKVTALPTAVADYAVYG